MSDKKKDKNKKRKHEQVDGAEATEDAEQRLAAMRAKYKNKQHTLIFSSRGITSRYRHLMNDLIDLTPHSKKEVKFDAKSNLSEINEVADYKNCNNVIFFECRKKQDLYLWLTRAPRGPSVKFHVSNVHTMNELKFVGNSLKGSRPILSFDKNFDSEPHLRLIKELLSQALGTPYMHPRSRPFIDHMLAFYWLDGRIWFRNYQIADEFVPEKEGKNKHEEVLIEMGPRFVMNPIKILSSSFGGTVIWENETYISPNTVRALRRNKKSGRYVERLAAEEARKFREQLNKPEPDELEFVFKPRPEEDEENGEGDKKGLGDFEDGEFDFMDEGSSGEEFDDEDDEGDDDGDDDGDEGDSDDDDE